MAQLDPPAKVASNDLLGHALPDPWDYCYEWDGPYGTRKFSQARHNGSLPSRAVPVFTAQQMSDFADAASDEVRRIEAAAWGESFCMQAAEIERLQATLKLQQASYEREIALDVAATHADYADGVRLMASKIERLREFLTIWIADGSLQTFEHREKFRAEAKTLLGA